MPQVYMYTLLLYPLISNFTIDCLWLYIVSVFFGCWAKLEKITQSRTSQPTQICVNRIALSQLCAFCHCYCACCHFIMHSAAVIVEITVGFLSQCSKINKSFLTLIKAKYFCYGVNPFFSGGGVFLRPPLHLSPYKHKKKHGQYPAILASPLFDNL